MVEKLDATNQAPLDGAEFTLWTGRGRERDRPTAADTSVDSCITGANGHCAVENLDFGTYYWEETAAPTGYQLPVDVFSASITVDTTNAGTTLPVRSFDDPRVLSELTVHKVDATDDEPLAGAQFQLFHDTNPVGPDAGDVLVDTCTTTLPDGTCTVVGLDFGRYYWEETVPPTGYDLPANPFSSPITIDADNAGTPLPVPTFRDPRATSRLVVEKLDATNQAPLGGAEFILWLDEDGNAGPPTDGDTSMGSCTTVPLLGRCSIPDLDFGTYYWEETAAPTGYDLPDDVFSAPITIDASNAGTVTTTQMMDPRTPGTLVVLKTDAGTDEPLADAEFTLWMDQDGNDGPPTTADEQMGTCTTALPSGSCEIDGLDFGVYYWEETTPPPGYELAADPFSAPIRVGPGGVRDVAYSAFADDRVVTALAVGKVDAADGAPLAGAEFTLFLDDPPAGPDAGDSVAGRCTTAAPDGTCSVGGLDFGDYYWVETEAPAGYFLPDPPPTKSVTITAENAGESQRVTFRDTRIGGLIVHKEQLYNGGSGPLRPLQGTIDYGVPVVYRVTVTSTGPGTNHDVHVSDYIPGYNPDDTTSTTKATYVPGSQRCVDAGPCDTTINRRAGLLTWAVGDLAAGRSRTVEFRAELPIPAAAAQQQPGTYTDTAWNQALAWSDENDKTPSNTVRAQARIQVSLVAPTGQVLPEEDQPGGLLPALVARWAER